MSRAVAAQPAGAYDPCVARGGDRARRQPGPSRREVLLSGAATVLGASVGLGGCRGGGAATMSIEEHAEAAREAFERARRFVLGWEAYRDPGTGLYATNSREAIWRPRDAAADLWPFMVLSTYFTDRARFETEMAETLAAEIALTSRLGRLPDDFVLETRDFESPTVDVDRIIFGAAEHAKDGLLPIAEVIGRGAYFDRLISIADGLCANANHATDRGPVPGRVAEVHGDLLQLFARLFFATGKEDYLEMGERIYWYRLRENPLAHADTIRLRDHGGELLPGLVEVHLALEQAGRPGDLDALLELLDVILRVGTNEDGLFYNEVDPETGEVTSDAIADTWGYIYDAYYTLGVIEGVERYVAAVREAMENVAAYRGFPWAGEGADGYADSIEGALVLLGQEPCAALSDWVETETAILFSKQHESGVIYGTHPDGNFARTALMYALSHSLGVHTDSWRDDLRIGATSKGGSLVALLAADAPWVGRLCFDGPRHHTNLGLPLNYPRVNSFPEWLPVEPGRTYSVHAADFTGTFDGADLIAGLRLRLEGEAPELRLRVTPLFSRP